MSGDGFIGCWDIILPASAKAFVKEDYGQQLIALGAREGEFCGKKLLLSFKNLVVTGFAGDVSLGGQLDGCFQSPHLHDPLVAHFGKALARGECVGNIAQRSQGSLAVMQRSFIARGFGLAILSD